MTANDHEPMPLLEKGMFEEEETMTIDEAIDYIETRAKDLDFRGYEREAQAQRLGIEALNRIKEQRAEMARLYPMLLPGETKD